MRNYILLILITIPLFLHSQEAINTLECPGEHPMYYAKEDIVIYQDFSQSSAIVGTIPKGGQAYVLESFFGDVNGFWQVCHKGKTGYVQKDNLSYKQISKSTVNGSSMDANNKNTMKQYEETPEQLTRPEPSSKTIIEIKGDKKKALDILRKNGIEFIIYYAQDDE